MTTDIADRLSLSRDRMRQALLGTAPPRRLDDAAGHAGAASFSWLDGLKAMPLAGVVIDALSGWWAQHPLRMVVAVASTATKAVVEPIARSNPLGLVLATVLLGGIAVWSRPWRWVLKPALFAGLAPQLLRSALARLPPPQPSANRSKNA